jgi:hypothetical protein
MEGMHTVGVLQLKDKYHFHSLVTCCVFIYVVILMGFSCDYYMYDFTISFALCCVIVECKSSVKY